MFGYVQRVDTCAPISSSSFLCMTHFKGNLLTIHCDFSSHGSFGMKSCLSFCFYFVKFFIMKLVISNSGISATIENQIMFDIYTCFFHVIIFFKKNVHRMCAHLRCKYDEFMLFSKQFRQINCCDFLDVLWQLHGAFRRLFLNHASSYNEMGGS